MMTGYGYEIRRQVIGSDDDSVFIRISRGGRVVSEYSIPRRPLGVRFTPTGIVPVTDSLPDEPFSFVGAPTQRRRMKMPATSPAKAILAAVAAFLASFLATVQGRTDLASMKAIDWIIVLLSAAVTGVGVYLVPNKPTGTRRNEGGQTNIIGAVIGLLLVVLLIFLILRIA